MALNAAENNDTLNDCAWLYRELRFLASFGST